MPDKLTLTELEAYIKQLEKLIRLTKVSHGWMLTSLCHEKDEGMYSDEIKTAIILQDAMKEI